MGNCLDVPYRTYGFCCLLGVGVADLACCGLIVCLLACLLAAGLDFVSL